MQPTSLVDGRRWWFPEQGLIRQRASYVVGCTTVMGRPHDRAPRILSRRFVAAVVVGSLPTPINVPSTRIDVQSSAAVQFELRTEMARCLTQAARFYDRRDIAGGPLRSKKIDDVSYSWPQPIWTPT